MIPKLTQGVDNDTPSATVLSQRKADLRETVEHYLPEVVETVKRTLAYGKDDKGRYPTVAFPQDSFSVNYDMDEYTLMGMAAKYVGLFGLQLWFISSQEG